MICETLGRYWMIRYPVLTFPLQEEEQSRRMASDIGFGEMMRRKELEVI
jgi:hypothetical protein